MLTVHHLGKSQSDRIVWLCEELEIPYELKLYKRDPVTQLAPPEYLELHPGGTAPVITDGDVSLGESGAIIEYIINRYGGGRLTVEPDSPDYAEYLYWFHYANGSLMPASMIDLVVEMMGGGGKGVVNALRERSNRGFAMVEHRLKEADYFAGREFTAADIIMLFPLTTMRAFAKRDLNPYAHIKKYLQRIVARPAYKRASAKADPDLRPLID